MLIQPLQPLFLDIETTYSSDPSVHERVAATIRPPGSMTKPETIAKWESEKKPAAVAEAMSKTALDGGYGRIVAIGFAVENEEPCVLDDEDEGQLLLRLFGLPVDHGAIPVIVGHNVIGFDLRFIVHRAVVLGIRIPSWFPTREVKPWSSLAFDTMLMWAGARGRISQSELAAILGVEVKPTIDGSKVPAAWHAGERADIVEHCLEDIRVLREIYRKMKVAGL